MLVDHLGQSASFTAIFDIAIDTERRSVDCMWLHHQRVGRYANVPAAHCLDRIMTRGLACSRIVPAPVMFARQRLRSLEPSECSTRYCSLRGLVTELLAIPIETSSQCHQCSSALSTIGSVSTSSTFEHCIECTARTVACASLLHGILKDNKTAAFKVDTSHQSTETLRRRHS